MATTKLWHIKGHSKDLIEYVENPEKTVVTDKAAEDFFNVFSYTWNPVKTEGGQYVTAINCQNDIALNQMGIFLIPTAAGYHVAVMRSGYGNYKQLAASLLT